MTETNYINMISAISGVLLGVLAWIGVRIFSKLDGLSNQVSDFHRGLQAQIADGDNLLHGRINDLDRRVTRVETRCSIEHEAGGGKQ